MFRLFLNSLWTIYCFGAGSAGVAFGDGRGMIAIGGVLLGFGVVDVVDTLSDSYADRRGRV